MGCSFLAPIQQALGGVADVVLQVASVVPGPWQPVALGVNAIHQANRGNIVGAIASGIGAFGSVGGFTSAGANTSMFNPFNASTSTTGGMLSGAGNQSAGYTLTGDGIADMGVLRDMGYSGQAAEAFINTGGAGAFVLGNGQGAISAADSGLSVTDAVAKYGKPFAQAIGLTNAAGDIDYAKLAATGASLVGGYLNSKASSQAAQTQANSQIEAARIAADAAKFRPVGVATRFGTSRFGYDNQGNLSTAGYDLSPEMKAQQDRLMGVSNNALTQYEGAAGATAPMGQAAQTMMTLGNNYLATTPQQQAQKYMAEQQALLATGRERDFSTLQNTMFNQGRGGLAVGGTATGMGAANPQLEAFYNAQRQQDLGLAAQATQGGMDYAKFGAGMVGSGGDMLRGMYGTQTAAYNPYSTALGGSSYIEGLGQNALDQGINIGAKGTAATAASGMLLANGMNNAANTLGTNAQQVGSPFGNMLQGAGQSLNTLAQGQQTYDPGKFRIVPL